MCRVYTDSKMCKQNVFVGDVFENNVGDKAVVVKYEGCGSVTITFLCDKPTDMVCQVSQLRGGRFKNPYSPFVQGVGYNGVGKFLVKVDNKTTREYRTWKSMLVRSFCPITKSKFPTYADCTVCEEWLDFQVFSSWLVKQDNWREYDLDKDLLIKGNKHYSPSTCVLLPSFINITLAGGGKGKVFPKGVAKYNNTGKFMARHKGTTLGIYETIGEAFLIYKEKRESHIKEVANIYKDQIDPKAYEALMDYCVNIDD